MCLKVTCTVTKNNTMTQYLKDTCSLYYDSCTVMEKFQQLTLLLFYYVRKILCTMADEEIHCTLMKKFQTYIQFVLKILCEHVLNSVVYTCRQFCILFPYIHCIYLDDNSENFSTVCHQILTVMSAHVLVQQFPYHKAQHLLTVYNCMQIVCHQL